MAGASASPKPAASVRESVRSEGAARRGPRASARLSRPRLTGRPRRGILAPVRIRPIFEDDGALVDALVPLSVRAAALSSPAWLPTPDDARAEILRALRPGGACLALVDGATALGWGGAFRSEATAWEIHPLLVDPAHHGRGAGGRLVAELEAVAARAGALVMELSTSDALGATTLAGRDLYADPLGALSRLDVREPGTRHAVLFWRAVGYSVVGVLPDAEGEGVPSIRFAKRLAPAGHR